MELRIPGFDYDRGWIRYTPGASAWFSADPWTIRKPSATAFHLFLLAHPADLPEKCPEEVAAAIRELYSDGRS